MPQKFLTRITTIDGSVSHPAYSFSNRTDTGMWVDDHGSNDRLRFSVDGTVRLYLDSNGVNAVGNVYLNSGNSFRNYSGVWQATTGTTENGFTFTNTADSQVMFEAQHDFIRHTSDGSATDGATLYLKHANNNLTDTIGTIFFGNNADATLSKIVAETNGANNTSNLIFGTSSAGTMGTALTLNADKSATFAGHLKLNTGKALRLYNAAGNAWAEVAFNESLNMLQIQRGLVASSDSALNLGTSSVRWANVYADNYYGDGSNLTGITATDSTKVAKAGDTMTGNLTLNDNVNLRFGTSGAESTIKSDGADTIMTLSSGSFLIGTNGGTPHDNSGKADFAVDVNADPQISLYSGQVQVGGTDMNWNAKILYNGTTQFAAWDNDIQIFTQGSSGASEKTIWIRPQGTDGTITTRAKFMGDSGVYLYGTTTVAGDIMPSADSTYDIGSNASKWAEGHFDHVYIGETGNNPRIDIYTENASANIADSFTDTTTDKSYIYFNAGTSSSDPGYIMHETSDSETNEGVLHLVPSDDNSTGDYVSIHGTNDPDVLKLHTSGLIETVNLQLQLKSGLNAVYINDELTTTGNITTTADGTYNIGSNGSRFANGYFDAVGVTNTLTVGTINATNYGLVAGDIPNISTDKLTSGTLPVARGGTGLTANTTYINSNAFANFIATTADYDTLTTRGLYRFQGSSNGPSGTTHTTGITLTENSGNYGWQMASHSSANNTEGLHYRYRGTSWGPWQTLVTKTFGDGRYLKITDYNPTPNAPTNLTTTIVGETVNVTFTASSTSNIDYYLVFSSVAGGDYGLISVIPPDDFGATMSVIDDSFDRPGTQAYRVYAVKNGVYSSALTGSISYTISTTEPTNMSVIAMNSAYYVQWDPPSTNTRFVANYNVYKHEHATASSLSFSSASLIYSGNRTSYMYAISGADNNNFHKFWVTITMAS